MENIKKNDLWKYASIGLAFLLLLLVLLYPLGGRASASTVTGAGLTQAPERTIDVTGTADVLVAPDEVNITVGIETRSADFDKAKEENNKCAKEVIELSKKYGIDPKHVQSDYIKTYPSYVYDHEKYVETTRISYYTVQKRIVIKLKDIGKFEELVSEITGNGSIMIQNIEFRSTKLSEYRNDARKLAARAAKDKAELLTSELGSRIGEVVTINEEQIDNYSWYGSWWSGSWYGYGQPNLLSNVAVNYQNNQGGSGSGQEGETVSIGQIKITARIRVAFALD